MSGGEGEQGLCRLWSDWWMENGHYRNRRDRRCACWLSGYCPALGASGGASPAPQGGEDIRDMDTTPRDTDACAGPIHTQTSSLPLKLVITIDIRHLTVAELPAP